MAKRLFRLVGLIIIVALLCMAVIWCIMLYRQKMEPPIPEDAETLKVKIVSVNIYEGGATIEVLNNGKVDGIYLRADTVIEDIDGTACDYADLEAGQVVEAMVSPMVIHYAYEQVGITDKKPPVQVFSQCYKVIIKENKD